MFQKGQTQCLTLIAKCNAYQLQAIFKSRQLEANMGVKVLLLKVQAYPMASLTFLAID
jgi:hypothetical protein